MSQTWCCEKWCCSALFEHARLADWLSEPEIDECGVLSIVHDVAQRQIVLTPAMLVNLDARATRACVSGAQQHSSSDPNEFARDERKSQQKIKKLWRWRRQQPASPGTDSDENSTLKASGKRNAHHTQTKAHLFERRKHIYDHFLGLGSPHGAMRSQMLFERHTVHKRDANRDAICSNSKQAKAKA